MPGGASTGGPSPGPRRPRSAALTTATFLGSPPSRSSRTPIRTPVRRRRRRSVIRRWCSSPGTFPTGPTRTRRSGSPREILPGIRASVPGARLRLVGNPTTGIEQLAGLPGVTVTGFVPSIGEELRAAAIVAAPMDVVSGTNVKVVEAFAFGVPVVATSAATTGLVASAGRELEVADTPGGFVAACVRLLTDRRSSRREDQTAARDLRGRVPSRPRGRTGRRRGPTSPRGPLIDLVIDAAEARRRRQGQYCSDR